MDNEKTGFSYMVITTSRFDVRPAGVCPILNHLSFYGIVRKHGCLCATVSRLLQIVDPGFSKPDV